MRKRGAGFVCRKQKVIDGYEYDFNNNGKYCLSNSAIATGGEAPVIDWRVQKCF